MSVYKRKSGRWAVLVDVDRGPRGERKRRALGTYSTRKEAERAERDALSARDRGIDLLPGTVTVKDLVARYLQARVSLGRGEKTIEEYERQARLYVYPDLGSVPVSKLRPAHISAWVGTLLERGGKDGRPLSAKTAKHAFALLSSALRWGVQMELAGRNVCESVAAPSPRRFEARAFNVAEIGHLMAAARGTRWENFVTLALMLGARRGELLALHWGDVDLDARRVTIRASLSQTDKGVSLKSTKSGRVRVIPLSGPAHEAFRRQRVLQKADRLREGPQYCADSGDPVFTNETGARLTPKAATNAFFRIATAAKVSTTSLHAARHTAATNMIAGGVDIRTTAGILGHTTPNVTLALYSHIVEGAESAAVDILAERLGRSAADNAS